MKNKFMYNEREEGFDNHISRSIPGYDTLINLTTSLSNHWITEDDQRVVVDVGGSTGKLLNALQLETSIQKSKFFLVDTTDFEEARISNPYINFCLNDINQFLMNFGVNCEIIYSMFTLQFMNDQDRFDALLNIHKSLHEDGVFIVAEKIYQQDAELQETFSCCLRNEKLKNFSGEDIIKKDHNLLRQLNLKTEENLLDELNTVGFNAVKYWQSLHFCAYICRKA